MSTAPSTTAAATSAAASTTNSEPVTSQSDGLWPYPCPSMHQSSHRIVLLPLDDVVLTVTADRCVPDGHTSGAVNRAVTGATATPAVAPRKPANSAMGNEVATTTTKGDGCRRGGDVGTGICGLCIG